MTLCSQRRAKLKKIGFVFASQGVADFSDEAEPELVSEPNPDIFISGLGVKNALKSKFFSSFFMLALLTQQAQL